MKHTKAYSNYGNHRTALNAFIHAAVTKTFSYVLTFAALIVTVTHYKQQSTSISILVRIEFFWFGIYRIVCELFYFYIE